MNESPFLTILGGGPAGLSAGYFAKKQNLSLRIYEASHRTGGNAITLTHGNFRFDSGAHRFHDRDPEVMREIMCLLGDEMRKINAPSQIFYNGKFIDFPLSPLDLLINLGIPTFAKAGLELLAARLKKEPGNGSFESFAVRTYGSTIANRFLLNYTEKLWGRPCNTLSPHISGRRLKGLDLMTFIREAFLGKNIKTTHLDGGFYYPKRGFGSIVESLAEACGTENIRTNSPITRINHQHGRIESIEINGGDRVSVDEVVSTLPLPILLRILEPQPKASILNLAKNLKFRNLILVVLIVDQDSISKNASIYISDPDIPFTRIYEPKNRSASMSPDGKTTLCIELPCDPGDELWNTSDERLKRMVRTQLNQLGIVREEIIIEDLVYRMSHAYPVLELGVEEQIHTLYDYLEGFGNLKLSGRNGRFLYTHVVDLMRFGIDLVQEYIDVDRVSEPSVH
jgi:protoporphyrinogen oxidase